MSTISRHLVRTALTSLLVLCAACGLGSGTAQAASFPASIPTGAESATLVLDAGRYVGPADGIRQARAALRRSETGAFLDRGANDRDVVVLSDTTQRCGSGAIGCNLNVYGTNAVWIDWNWVRWRSPEVVAGLLAHEFTHAIEQREYRQVAAYFGGEAGVWTEVRANMVEARVTRELGAFPLNYATSLSTGRLLSAEETAQRIRPLYASHYGISATRRPALQVPMTVGNPYIGILATRAV